MDILASVYNHFNHECLNKENVVEDWRRMDIFASVYNHFNHECLKYWKVEDWRRMDILASEICI